MYTVEGGGGRGRRGSREKGCTAIVCGSDLMALGAAGGRPVGGYAASRDDISIIGYDDSTLIAFTDPPLTTIRQRVLAMGEAAVQGAPSTRLQGIEASRTEYVFWLGAGGARLDRRVPLAPRPAPHPVAGAASLSARRPRRSPAPAAPAAVPTSRRHRPPSGPGTRRGSFRRRP